MRTFSLLACLFLIACGPAVREDAGDDVGGDDDPAGAPDAADCRDNAEACGNGIDDDCDGFTDCDDVACFDVGECGNPGNCGTLDEQTGSLALPDGTGASYENALTFTGFSDGQVLEQVEDLLGICVNMEHSWLRDLQIEIQCPSGQMVVLQMFLGQTGSEIYMGQPNDTDGTTPVPGVGADYCWTPNATNPPMLDYCNQNPLVHDLPPGDYRSVTPFSNLVGCPLNGDWTIRVQDLWGIDNGFIFSWSVRFDPSIVEDCDSWPDPD